MTLPESFTVEDFLAGPRHYVLNESAAETVARACHRAGRNSVWIEGFSQSGKTSFADVIGERLGWRVVHLDTLASDNAKCDSYLAAMDSLKLREALGTAELRHQVVIEGICLRDVVGVLADRQSTLTLYLMRVGKPAERLIWYDAGDFNNINAQLDWTDRCAHEYHRRTRPQDNADLTFARVE